MRDAIKSAGARLRFLPQYFPDLNPIEQIFAKIKHWMRMTQKRTIEEAWKQVGNIVGSITPKEYANYLRISEYAPIKTR